MGYYKREKACPINLIKLFYIDAQQLGIKVNDDDLWVVDKIESYIIENKLLSLNEMVEWNTKALNYLKHKNKSTSDFLNLFYRTKQMRAIKDKLPLDTLVSQAITERDEFKATIVFLLGDMEKKDGQR